MRGSKVKKNAGIFVGKEDFVASYSIDSTIERDLGRQVLVTDDWLLITNAYVRKALDMIEERFLVSA